MSFTIPSYSNIGIIPSFGSQSTSISSVLNTVNSVSSTVSGVSGIFDAVAPLINGLLSGDIFSKTLGQIKDGFDCWGSSWTPSRAKDQLPFYFEAFTNLLAQAFQTEVIDQNKLNNVFYEIWNVVHTKTPLQTHIGWKYDTAQDCTLRGLTDLEIGIDAFLIEMENIAKQALNQLGYTASVSHVNITLYRFPDTQEKKYTKKIPQFAISKTTSSGSVPVLDSNGDEVVSDSSSITSLLVTGLAVFLGRKLF